jgi:histidine triad (HIT) family protein
MNAEPCLFCQITRGGAQAAFVHRDEQVVAFRDIRPVAPTHILIVPTSHVRSLAELETSDEGLVGKMLTVCRSLARAEGLESSGYRVVINSGSDAGQSVFHLHMHLLGGRRMGWPPG